jgi:hypothetical protein
MKVKSRTPIYKILKTDNNDELFDYFSVCKENLMRLKNDELSRNLENIKFDKIQIKVFIIFCLVHWPFLRRHVYQTCKKYHCDIEINSSYSDFYITTVPICEDYSLYHLQNHEDFLHKFRKQYKIFFKI